MLQLVTKVSSSIQVVFWEEENNSKSISHKIYLLFYSTIRRFK